MKNGYGKRLKTAGVVLKVIREIGSIKGKMNDVLLELSTKSGYSISSVLTIFSGIRTDKFEKLSKGITIEYPKRGIIRIRVKEDIEEQVKAKVNKMFDKPTPDMDLQDLIKVNIDILEALEKMGCLLQDLLKVWQK